MASGCVLGYWDDHGYVNHPPFEDLIDGGDSGTIGCSEREDPGCPYTRGYRGLIYDELGPAMGWEKYEGTTPSSVSRGIREVCNSYNNYVFSVPVRSTEVFFNEFGPGSEERSTYENEILAGRPFAYSIGDYPGPPGCHTVTAVGYLVEDNPDFDHWKIVRDNSPNTSTNIYIWEGEIGPWAAIHRATPPGQAKPVLADASDNYSSLINAQSYPNPFNSQTTID